MKIRKPWMTLLIAAIVAQFATATWLTAGEKAEDKKAPTVTPVSNSLSPELTAKVQAAVNSGVDWLAKQQKKDGSWSESSFPAITALALDAIANSPNTHHKKTITKAVKYIRSCVQKDGGIYKKIPGRKGGGLSNYNTAICMMALHDVQDHSLDQIILNARSFIAASQHMDKDVFYGGFGYDSSNDRKYTDLMNTYFAEEAMRRTVDVEDRRKDGTKHTDIDWNAALKYIEKVQNKPVSGPDNAGGFFYNPTEAEAGTTTNEQGVIYFRSFGSMTYVGMMALMHANVTRDDPRVRSAFDWSCQHWSLDENPGRGDAGLYFFYYVLSKCLDAYGQNVLTVQKSKAVNWKQAFVERMLKLQKTDEKTGKTYWVNSSNREMENDNVLVTAYTLIALERVLND